MIKKTFNDPRFVVAYIKSLPEKDLVKLIYESAGRRNMVVEIQFDELAAAYYSMRKAKNTVEKVEVIEPDVLMIEGVIDD